MFSGNLNKSISVIANSAKQSSMPDKSALSGSPRRCGLYALQGACDDGVNNPHLTGRPRQAGFSLIEVIVAMLLISVGVLGLLSAMNTTVKGSADPMVRKQAIAVAESLLEEIALKDFADPGGPACAARNCFDDVSDYASYQTTGGIVDISGAAIGGLSGYNISSVTVANAALGSIGSSDAKLITVTVTAPGGEAISLSAYRTKL